MPLRIHALLFMIFTLLAGQLAAEIPKPEKIQLWPEGKSPVAPGEFENSPATLTIYRPSKPNGTAIIICPGGGYGSVVGAEGAPIANWLNTQGITGLVLKYRLPKGNPHRPLLDALHAIRLTRHKAKSWSLDSKRIGIMGFSAGGHLAAMASTKFDLGEGKNTDPVQRESSRPDFAVLIYPVITMGEHTHSGSKRNLLGANPSPEITKLYSNEHQVTAHSPPAFLAHAADDKPVPPINSELFYQALLAKKIPAKYLSLASGGHGLNGYQGPMWEAWKTQSMKWLTELK